jgi:ketosteroid isomerase-like protein
MACAPSAAELTEEDRSAITALSEGYLQALVDGDVAALRFLFEEDGTRLANGGQAMHGRAAFQSIPADAFLDFQTANVTIGGNGDLAYSWLDYELTVGASEGVEPTINYGRFLNVIRRQPDGAWLFVSVMYNSRPAP